MNKKDYLKAVNVNGKDYNIFNINKLEENKISNISRLPFSIRVLVENLLRNMDDDIVKEEDLLKIAGWKKNYDQPVEIPHHPARVLMQDFTGVPAVVDLASMRDAVEKLGGDPSIINPLVPTELIIDHSIQVDYFGTEDSLKKNVEMEYHRNRERYELLKWAQGSFNNFKVVPPNSGICHQVNLECLGRVIITEEVDGIMTAYPDSLVGTDSHTTMINGIGVMGWGVGGIEAEAVMLGQPYYMSIPEVIGMKLTGELKEGITATDLVLTITEILRQHNVVEKFVEYFGSGYKNLNVPNRATLANMSPEYGATMGFCPVDEKTIEYLEMTGRKDQAGIVEECSKAIGLFYTGEKDPEYSKVIEFDLSEVEPSLAGPSRPQDRITLKTIKPEYYETLDSPIDKETTKAIEKHNLNINGNEAQIRDGSIVIAAITSCTNTSNPSVMIGAGLLAKNAVKKGLKVPHHVKTSLAPGSKVVSQYLDNSGLTSYLELLGFNIVAYGCTTCIGNSGPLHSEIEKLIDEKDINTASVLSGNRNFEARIHQKIKSNYLASPLLVIAFAIAGRIDIDLNTEPVGFDPNGDSVYLKDLWPSNTEILELVTKYVTNDLYESEFKHIFEGDEFWKELIVPEGTTFKWDDNSTYIKNPPYFKNFDLELSNAPEVKDARLLLLLGDSVTTDHISPAGAIPANYPAGSYLIERGVSPTDFNSYGSRRGNDDVMTRGTFGNIRIKNQLVSPKEGSFTIKFPKKDEKYVYDAALEYADEGIPLVVLGGKEYGTGSSRDWAAKGTNLLGIKAVITESYERIHRSNLVGMGVLPLLFKDGDSWQSLGLDGSELYTITGIEDMEPRKTLSVKAVKDNKTEINFDVISRLDSVVDISYFYNGGILPFVLRKLMKEK